MIFSTLDGESTWTAELNPQALVEAEEHLSRLRQSLNKLHNDDCNNTPQKLLICGLTYGIEAYLEILKKGRINNHDRS